MKQMDSEHVERLNAIQNAMIDSCITIGKSGTIIETNPATTIMFGWEKKEMIGENVKMLMPEPYKSEHDLYLESYLRTKEKKVIGSGRELRAMKKDGSLFWIHLTVCEICISGKIGFTGFIRNVQQLKDEQRRSKERIERVLAVSEAMVDGVITIDKKGIILEMNAKAGMMFQVNKEEMVGTNVKDKIMPEPHKSHHDQYLENYLKTGEEKVINKGRELRAKRMDGTLFWMFLTVVPIKINGDTCFTAFVRDIQNQKDEAERLSIERQKFSLDALVVITAQGIITECSESCLTLFGYKKEEMIGENVKLITPPEHADKHDSYIQNYLRTGNKKAMGKSRELMARKKNGALFPMELSLSEIKGDSEHSHFFIGSVRDLTEKKVKEEQDILLMNMLPRSIANKLLETPGSHIAEHFDEATILFADVVGFTKMSETLPPMTVVMYLNRIFSAWDSIAEKLNVEKIKTIGDAYMAVAGIPDRCKNHSEIMLKFALAMLEELDKFNSQNEQTGDPVFGLRVGINCGTIVAGVIGSKKFLYDIWGASCNLASRMESTGVDRRIQVSENVYKETKHCKEFRFTKRGKVYCKGIGDVLTYFVEDATKQSVISKEELGDVVAKNKP